MRGGAHFSDDSQVEDVFFEDVPLHRLAPDVVLELVALEVVGLASHVREIPFQRCSALGFAD